MCHLIWYGLAASYLLRGQSGHGAVEVDINEALDSFSGSTLRILPTARSLKTYIPIKYLFIHHNKGCIDSNDEITSVER